MSEPPKAKPHDPHAWKPFFLSELQNLKIRTGILQYEKMKESPKAREDARLLVAAMIVECNKHPYDRIKKDVLQRVIHSAVVDDQDFIGFSVKWIRKTLNAWWNLYGDKILRELNRIDDEERERLKPIPPPNPHEDVNHLVETYKKRLQREAAAMKTLPRMNPDVAKKEGAEWTSEIERKAIIIPSNGLTKDQVAFRDRLLRAGSTYYQNKDSYDLKKFSVNDTDVYAESEHDAIQIYTMAMKNN